MNAQIEKLAIDCYQAPEFDYKKFAELIIQECIEVIEPCKCGCCDGEPEGVIADTIIKQIKEHFGLSDGL